MAETPALLSTQIRIATPADQCFIESLARKFSNEVGFIPRAALQWYIEAGRVTVALENDEPAGYLLGRDSLRWCRAMRPITQAAIHFDAQRRHHGLAIVAATETSCREAGQVAIQACCREGIDANYFWLEAGFQAICQLDPLNARNKKIICWRKLLTDFVPPWFHAPPQASGWKARKTPGRIPAQPTAAAERLNAAAAPLPALH